ESMLDQLVAFCGEKITVDDVQTVFGFTSAETVHALTGFIFAQDAGGVLALVAEQAAAGKDLSRLMSDVIVSLRDRLVASVQSETSDVPREKLLALLEHFAETEGRLRWATDKRLYFDVAVIKAVHLLGEASLGDVIDTLVAIGGGEAPPAKPAPRPVPAAAPAAPAAPPKVQRVSAPSPTVVAEEPPKEAAPEPPAVVAGVEDVWREVSETLASESPIRFGWLVSGESAGLVDGRLRVIFPTTNHEQTESSFWEGLRRRAETDLSAKLGSKVSLHCEFTKEVVEAAPEPVEEESAPAPQAAKEPVDPMAEFKNDPLIRKALEIFKAEIQTT
ncbi:MAG: hypothetical protein ACREKL_07390, partial [Chthoniobacterales bacterium]